MPDSEPIIPPGVRTLSVLPRTPAPPPTEATFARKPAWLKVRASYGPNYRALKGLMRDADLHTVCEEAGCPNIFECWEAREATFLIGGEHCTRACPFCQIATGKPDGYDTDEPRRVAHAVARMGLRFAVITGVARDDLDDGGAWLFAESVRQVRELLPTCGVEVLVPDFHGKSEALRQVTDVRPDVLGHNIETVSRLYKRVRPGFTYAGSLELLARARAWLPPGYAIKSNLILGMGEERDEVEETMRHLREVGVELLTITQYLQPTRDHLNLQRFVSPEEFEELRQAAVELGFTHVESGALVRSSYHAGQMHRAAYAKQHGSLPRWALAADAADAAAHPAARAAEA
jgi:lipoic acid synthetase